MFNLSKGTAFTAQNKLKQTHQYIYDGIENELPEFHPKKGEHKLIINRPLDENESPFMYVETEWFNQRIVKEE